MTREEAIEIVRKMVCNIYQTDAEKEALGTLIPELAESEDEKIRRGLVKLITVAGEASVVNFTGIKKDSYLAYLEKQKEQKPAEWSEEDKKALDMCLDAIPKRRKTESGILLTKWLKDNIHPQPKQEWSEEDEETIGTLINYFEGDALDYSTDEMVRRIRALSPHWKPSEEQMNTLAIVIDEYYHACTKGSDDKSKTLKTLFEQLKKL